jgi:hypothetical protein
MVKDAFDRWWEWAGKPADSVLTIPVPLARIRDKIFSRTAAGSKNALQRSASVPIIDTSHSFAPNQFGPIEAGRSGVRT